MNSNLDRISYAVRFLNNIYGRGTVRFVVLFADGGGYFIRERYGLQPEERKFRLSKNGKSVIALGHQKQIDFQ